MGDVISINRKKEDAVPDAPTNPDLALIEKLNKGKEERLKKDRNNRNKAVKATYRIKD